MCFIQIYFRSANKKMQFLSLAFLAASALAVADTTNEGAQGNPGLSWVQDFDNLVAFGDRLEPPIPTDPN